MHLPPAGDDDAIHVPAFTPVPLARARRDGWTADRQRRFIAALARTGVVAVAARAAGMGVTSAYNLRRRRGAESFAAAWAIAEGDARDRALDLVLRQVRDGVTLPRFYRGRIIGTVHRHDTALALAALRAIAAAERAGAKVKR